METKIYKILGDMSEELNYHQLEVLQQVLFNRLSEDIVVEETQLENDDYLELFVAAKRVEGCTERTIEYYRGTIGKMFSQVAMPVRRITTDVLRKYLTEYQSENNCSKVTIDNVRRNLSSFFSWLEDEDHIIKSPIRRIHKVKTGTVVKETFTDEQIEQLRDGCNCTRDLAIIDLLFSTGMRVGELCNLDIEDINFNERECVVYGKGNKERRVYFDARAKLSMMKYLEMRADKNKALFVSLDSPFERISVHSVEQRLRELGKRLCINKVHPHKFRRSMATKAIDKGMPIEQVQKLLGHQQIDTTMHYAMVNQTNVKNSHRRYIA